MLHSAALDHGYSGDRHDASIRFFAEIHAKSVLRAALFCGSPYTRQQIAKEYVCIFYDLQDIVTLYEAAFRESEKPRGMGSMTQTYCMVEYLATQTSEILGVDHVDIYPSVGGNLRKEPLTEWWVSALARARGVKYSPAAIDDVIRQIEALRVDAEQEVSPPDEEVPPEEPPSPSEDE